MKELSEIHGILGSNTVSDWLRKYGNLRPRKFSDTPIMSKPHASSEVAERINGIIKSEFGLGNCLKNLEEAQQLLEKAMHIYNHKRPHWSNHLLTPNQMHNQSVLKPISWEFNSKDDF